MSDLIKELEAEHKVLVEKLDYAKALKITSEEGKKALFDFKDLLLSHLKKEDEVLYPVLKNKSKNDNGLLKLIQDFTLDMEAISKKVIKFFQKYENNPNDEDYAVDVGIVIGLLKVRIQREEMLLFPKCKNFGDVC